MKKIDVQTASPYPILIGDGIFHEIPALITPFCATKRVFMVTDDHVDTLLGQTLLSMLRTDFEAEYYVFPHGECSKTPETLFAILEFLAEKNCRRGDTLIALGGGVTGDLTGLAAALYMRGIRVIQIPTTLVAAVDASVGGKTAVNLQHGKNLAGVFWQPAAVLIDSDIIRALPSTLYAEGIAEAVKCNIIREMPVIRYIENHEDRAQIGDIITHCVTLKKEIVEQDETDEKGIRNVLNAGHTWAHAIEKLSGYTVPHGRAVGAGLVMEARLSEKLHLCDSDTVRKIEQALRPFGLPDENPFTAQEIADSMTHDKKNRDGKIVFMLPTAIGHVTEVRLSKEQIIELIG